MANDRGVLRILARVLLPVLKFRSSNIKMNQPAKGAHSPLPVPPTSFLLIKFLINTNFNKNKF
jgi:hypothetical protein